MRTRFLPRFIAALALLAALVIASPRPASAGNGDVDFDGTLRMTDAILVLRYLAGIEVLNSTQLVRCDMNGSFSCEPWDALSIARSAVTGQTVIISCPSFFCSPPSFP